MAEEEKNEAEERIEPSAQDEAAEEQASDEQPAAAEAESAEEAAAEDSAADEAAGGEQQAAAEPAVADEGGDGTAPATDGGGDEEPVAELSPKQRRKLARSTHAGEPGPELTAAARQQRREAERKRKAEARRRYRKGRGAARAKAAGKGSGTGTPPAVRETGNPKVRQGVVVSDRMDKTITVRVESARRHPAYEKVIRTSKMYHAHDERNEAGAGDTVRLVETRPMSKTKRWRLTEILEKAK
ncbi:MAG: hypothetical protein BroJett022_03710 [Actinomycetes bacterium]|nr:MAG: hypothetical protein BroJett022_03710 [Actinomycetes bacterium]